MYVCAYVYCVPNYYTNRVSDNSLAITKKDRITWQRIYDGRVKLNDFDIDAERRVTRVKNADKGGDTREKEARDEWDEMRPLTRVYTIYNSRTNGCSSKGSAIVNPQTDPYVMGDKLFV